MANEVTTNWTQVKNTATTNLAQTEAQLSQAEQVALQTQADLAKAQEAVRVQEQVKAQTIEKYRPRPAYEEILPLQQAYQADPTNAAKKAAWEKALAEFNQESAVFEREYKYVEGALNIVYSSLQRAIQQNETAQSQVRVLTQQSNQYAAQLDEANNQLALQSRSTTPATNNTVSGTTKPASPNPGDPSVPTATVTTPVTGSSAPKTTTDPATPATGNAAPVPSAITIVGDEPLISPEQINAEVANLQIELPPLPDLEQEVITFAAQQDATAFEAKADWRVRLSLSPDANYLYKADDPGILSPLAATDGVIFPYTPTIGVNYLANYDQTTLTHSNYKVYQYSNSSVEQVTISCDFTAQDVYEANYLLAVIHFFRSMTKMFYGQDQDPRRGTPPPLCYMFGLGNYQFSAHPLVINSFSYNLPNNVDYIKTVGQSFTGAPQPSGKTGNFNSNDRLAGTGAAAGGKRQKQKNNSPPNTSGEVTWVPTQIQLQITCFPIQTRNMVSNLFSLKDYANGKLLNGVRVGNAGGGMW